VQWGGGGPRWDAASGDQSPGRQPGSLITANHDLSPFIVATITLFRLPDINGIHAAPDIAGDVDPP